MITYPQPFKKVSILKDVDITYTTMMVDDDLYSTLTNQSGGRENEIHKETDNH